MLRGSLTPTTTHHRNPTIRAIAIARIAQIINNVKVDSSAIAARDRQNHMSQRGTMPVSPPLTETPASSRPKPTPHPGPPAANGTTNSRRSVLDDTEPGKASIQDHKPVTASPSAAASPPHNAIAGPAALTPRN